MKQALSELRNVLMQSMGVRRAQFYNKIKETADNLSLSTKEAILVLALKNRINLSKYKIPEETLARLRPLIPVPSDLQPMQRKVQQHRRVAITVIKPAHADDLLLPAKIISEVNEMVLIYQKLYILENSLRQFISRVMEHFHGNNWWNGHVTKDLDKKVQSRMSDEKRNAWHQRRGKNPIDYIDLADLKTIVRMNHKEFIPSFLPDLNWFEALLDEVYASRCVVCHMNPLEANNIKAIDVRYNHWKRQLQEKASQLP